MNHTNSLETPTGKERIRGILVSFMGEIYQATKDGNGYTLNEKHVDALEALITQEVTSAASIARFEQHMEDHGCGTGDTSSPYYVGGFINCPVAKKLFEAQPRENQIVLGSNALQHREG